MHSIRINILELFTKPKWQEDGEMLRLAVNGRWKDRELLHGHDKQGKSAYRFPLIRYIPSQNPAIVGLDGSLDVLEDIYQGMGKDIYTPSNNYTIEASELRGRDFDFGETDTLLELKTLTPWIGLNTSNYQKYIKAGRKKDRIALLESIWKGNILALAKGLDINVDWRIMAKIVDLREINLNIKGTPVLGLNARIVTNTKIPQWLGIGKHVTLGFGRWTG